MELLEECRKDGMVAAIGKGRFGDVKRTETGGKGLDGVVEKAPDYFNPFLEILEARVMIASLVLTLALALGRRVRLTLVKQSS